MAELQYRQCPENMYMHIVDNGRVAIQTMTQRIYAPKHFG